MNTNQPGPGRAKIHPLVAAAAIAVILLSGVGIATLLYNRSNATDAPQGLAQATNTDPAVTTPGAPAPGAATSSSATATPPVPYTVASNQTTTPAPVYNYPPAPAEPAPIACNDCATVESIHEVRVRGQGTGVGAVGGGVVGGLVGNSLGGGHGRGALTVLGVVGGALAGNQIEKNARSTNQYQMVVRFEDGTSRTFSRGSPWPYANGDHVKVVNGQVLAQN